MSGFVMTLEMDGVPPLNSAANLSWFVKYEHKKEWRKKVSASVLVYRRMFPTVPPLREPLQHAKIVITFGSSKAPDFDALAYGGKYLLDALNKDGERIIYDDGPQYIGKTVYQWIKTKRNATLTRVYIRECSQGELDLSAWDYKGIG